MDLRSERVEDNCHRIPGTTQRGQPLVTCGARIRASIATSLHLGINARFNCMFRAVIPKPCN